MQCVGGLGWLEPAVRNLPIRVGYTPAGCWKSWVLLVVAVVLLVDRPVEACCIMGPASAPPCTPSAELLEFYRKHLILHVPGAFNHPVGPHAIVQRGRCEQAAPRAGPH